MLYITPLKLRSYHKKLNVNPIFQHFAWSALKICIFQHYKPIPLKSTWFRYRVPSFYLTHRLRRTPY